MTENIFTTKLTKEEIMDNFKDVDFFTEITKGLQEAIEYESGKIPSKVETREHSDTSNTTKN